MNEDDKKVTEKPVEKTEKVEKTEVRDERNVPARRQMPSWFPWAAGGALIFLLLLGAFWAGRALDRDRSIAVNRTNGFSAMRGYSDIPNSGTQNLPSGNFRGRGMMGTYGTVTAISSDSITIKDTIRGGLVTFKINEDTKVTSGTDTKAVSDIKTDATVRVQASTSDSTIAAAIAIQS